MTGTPNSMFETVKNHEDRITSLEEADVKHEERLRIVETNYTNLENTILKSHQSQQDFFRDTLKNQFELLKARDESKDNDRKRAHEIALTNQEIKKSNLERAWEFAGKSTIAGGFLYLIADKWFL